MNRRAFLSVSAGVAAGVVVGGRALGASADDVVIEWKELVPGVRVGFGQGGNSTLISGKEVGYLVDTKNAPFGAFLRRKAEGAGPKVVVINTHHHGDHTGGNHAFTKDHVVMAHGMAVPRIEANMNRYVSQIKESLAAFQGKKGPEFDEARADWEKLYKNVTALKAKDFEPTQLVGDSKNVDTAGGAKLELKHFGPGHTDNDLVVHVPSMNVLVAGDILFNKVHPYVDPDGGGDTSGWMTSLKKAIELCDAKTKVVPGHGDLCGVEGLKGQLEYFEKVHEAVAKAVKAGKTRKEVSELKLSFPGYGNPDRASMALIGVYNEMTAKK